MSLSGVNSTSTGPVVVINSPLGTSISTSPSGGISMAQGQADSFLAQFEGPLSSLDVTDVSWNFTGTPSSVTDSEGYTLSFFYDNLDRQVETLYPDGTTEQTVYNRLDPVMQADRLGRWSRSAYDSLDQVICQTDPLGRSTTYCWCNCGSLASLTDPAGHTTNWHHDVEGRQVQKVYPDGSTVDFTYDPCAGRLATKTDAMGQTKSYLYNFDNSLLQKNYSNAVNSTSSVAKSFDTFYNRKTAIANGWGTNSFGYNTNSMVWLYDSPNTGDYVNVMVNNPALPGTGSQYRQHNVQYHVLATDTTNAILASSIASAINADSTISGASLTATSSSSGTYGFVTLTGTGSITVSPNANGVITETLGGTITNGDQVTITIYDLGIGGSTGYQSYTHNVTGTDTLSTIAADIQSHLSSDVSGYPAITVTQSGDAVIVTSSSVNPTTCSSQTNSGATETVTQTGGASEGVAAMVPSNLGNSRLASISNNVIPNSTTTYSYDVLGRPTNRSINGGSNSTSWSYDAISRKISEQDPLGTFNYAYVNDDPTPFTISGTATGSFNETITINPGSHNATFPVTNGMSAATVASGLCSAVNALGLAGVSSTVSGAVAQIQAPSGTTYGETAGAGISITPGSPPSSTGDPRLSYISYPYNGTGNQTTNFSYLPNIGDERLQQIANLSPSSTTISQFNQAYDSAGEIKQWLQNQNSTNTHMSLGYDAASQLISSTADSGSAFTAYVSGGPHGGDVVSITAYDASLTGTTPIGQETASYTVGSTDTTANVVSGLASAISSAMSNISVSASASGNTISITTSPSYCTQFTCSESGSGTPAVQHTVTVGSQPFAVAITPDGTKAYVPNDASGTVSVINTSTNTVSATVTVGSFPYAVAITPDGTKAYVPNYGSGTVSVINTSTNTVSATVTVGTQPVAVAITPDGTKAYVSNNNSGTVSVIDTSTNTVSATVTVGSLPCAVAITPDGTKTYVPNAGSGTVSVINTSTNTVSATVTVGGSPNAVAITPDGTKAYVPNFSLSGSVSVINTSTNTVSATVTVGSQAYAVAITPDGTKAYVTNYGSGTVSVIGTSTNTVSATVTVGSDPYAVAITPDGTKAYVPNAGSVSVINTATSTVSATVTVGSAPEAVAITPDGNKVYVPNLGSGTLSVITFDTTIALSQSSPVANLHKQLYYNYDQAGNMTGLQGDSTGTLGTGLTTTTTQYSYNCLNQMTGNSAGGPIRFQGTYANPVGSAVVNVGQTMTITAPGGITNGDVLTLTSHGSTSNTPQSFSYTVNSGTDTTTTLIATHFVSANSSALSAIGITATSSSNVVTLTSSSSAVTSYSAFASTAATEQLAIGTGAGNAGSVSPSDAFTANPVLAGGSSSTANTTSVTGVSGGGTAATNNYTVTVNSATPQQFAFDANGNMLGDGTNSYSYDAENRLVKIVYSSSPSVATALSVTGDPVAVALTPNGAQSYVAVSGTSSLYAINTSTNTIGATISLTSPANSVVVSPSGATAYAAGSGEVYVINTATNTLTTTVAVSGGTNDLAITPDGTQLFVSSSTGNNVSVINTATNTITDTLTVGSAPGAIAITPNGSNAYVLNTSSGTVSVISTETDAVSATVTVGSSPVALAITPDGSKVYVTNNSSNSVSVINTATNTVAATIPLGAGTAPDALAITPNGQYVYVVNASAGTVSVINTANNAVSSSTITVGTNPVAIAITPDGLNAYVVNDAMTGTVSVITLSSASVSSLSVGNNPVAVAIARNASMAYVCNSTGTSMSQINITSSNYSTMTYDGQGNQVKIVETGITPAYNGGSTKQFVFCGSQKCEERNSSGTLVTQFFERGYTNGGNNYYYTLDHLGSKREVYGPSGIVDVISYTPYGVPSLTVGSTLPDYGYAGYYYHSRSGLNMTATRAYSSALSRWINRDPIGIKGGVNLYDYVGNNPIDSIDPSGLSNITIAPLLAYSGDSAAPLGSGLGWMGNPQSGTPDSSPLKGGCKGGSGDGGGDGDGGPTIIPTIAEVPPGGGGVASIFFPGVHQSDKACQQCYVDWEKEILDCATEYRNNIASGMDPKTAAKILRKCKNDARKKFLECHKTFCQ